MFIQKYIKTFLAINVLIALICIVCLFVTTDTYGVYAASICAASTLFNCIGLTLLMRWHINGIYFVVGSSVISAVALSITCAGWLQYVFGPFGSLIPNLICLLYVGVLAILLCQKKEGKPIWRQMKRGLDYVHFRHIYQLCTFLWIGIFIIAYLMMPTNTDTATNEDDKVNYIDHVSEQRLDSPDITIEEVVSFEKEYNEKYEPNERILNITKRIFALKHLLLGGLMPDIHTRDNLVNIIKAHENDFSTEQQAIINWYLSLPVSLQEEWNVCDKVNTLSDFKRIINIKIKQ